MCSGAGEVGTDGADSADQVRSTTEQEESQGGRQRIYRRRLRAKYGVSMDAWTQLRRWPLQHVCYSDLRGRHTGARFGLTQTRQTRDVRDSG